MPFMYNEIIEDIGNTVLYSKESIRDMASNSTNTNETNITFSYLKPDEPHHHGAPGGWILALTIIVGVFIIITNVAALVFVLLMKDKRRFSLILPLSVNDIILGLATLLGLTSFHIRGDKYSSLECAGLHFGIELGLTASLFHTFCICLERFLAVQSKTFHEKLLTIRQQFKLIGISWLIIGLYFGILKIVTPAEISECSYPSVHGEYYLTFLRINLFGIWIPLLLLTIALYAGTMLILKKNLKKIGVSHPNSIEHQSVYSTSSFANDGNTPQSNLSFINASSSVGNSTISNHKFLQNANKTNLHHRTFHQNENPSANSLGITLFQQYRTHRETNLKEEDSHNNLLQLSTITSNSKETDTVENMPENTETRISSKCNESSQNKGAKSTFTSQHLTKVYPKPRRNNQHNVKKKAMKTVGLIVLVLSCTSGIGLCFFVIEAVCSDCSITSYTRRITSLCWFLNSALNPVIYLCVIQQFRRAFAKFLRCQYK